MKISAAFVCLMLVMSSFTVFSQGREARVQSTAVVEQVTDDYHLQVLDVVHGFKKTARLKDGDHFAIGQTRFDLTRRDEGVWVWPFFVQQETFKLALPQVGIERLLNVNALATTFAGARAGLKAHYTEHSCECYDRWDVTFYLGACPDVKNVFVRIQLVPDTDPTHPVNLVVFRMSDNYWEVIERHPGVAGIYNNSRLAETGSVTNFQRVVMNHSFPVDNKGGTHVVGDPITLALTMGSEIGKRQGKLRVEFESGETAGNIYFLWDTRVVMTVPTAGDEKWPDKGLLEGLDGGYPRGFRECNPKR